MKIDRKLNLVVPLERETGRVYVFSTPIAKEVFEQYFMVISKTFARIYAENLNFLGGPRICAMMLKDVALNTAKGDRTGNCWEGPDGVENGLMNEIRRLTNLLIPQEGAGWETIMYDAALKQSLLTEDEVSEVEGSIAFFIVNSAMHRRSTAASILEAAASMWGWQITSSSISDFKSSLTTSTAEDDTSLNPTAAQLSIPS